MIAETLKAKIKNKSNQNDAKPSAIVSRALRGISSPVTALLPLSSSINRTNQRVRVDYNPLFFNPVSRGQLVMPQ